MFKQLSTFIKKPALAITATVLAASVFLYDFSHAEATSDVRYAHLQPFSSESVWNTAMGSGAKFDPADSSRMKNFFNESAYINSNNGYGIALNIAELSDPVRSVTFQGKTYTHRIPADATVISGTDGNLNVIDGQYVYEYWQVKKKSDGNYTAGYGVKTDLLDSGIEGGIRAGQFSTNGGLIRQHELENLHMPHALVMALSAEQLKSGWVFPAISEDGGNNGYSGTIPMGSLFAIPPEVDIDKLGLSPEGHMLAEAMQDYGVYVGDRASQITLYASNDVERELPDAFKRMVKDFQSILKDELRYVTNNSKNSIGGGGEPRQPQQAEVVIADNPNKIENPANVAGKPNEGENERVEQPTPKPKEIFTDVPDNHRFAKEIKSMVEQGLIHGYTDGSYRPDASIERRHVAEIISRSNADLTPVRPGKDFKDVPKSHPNYDGIQKLYRAKIVDGSNGNFHPSARLTRAESAKIFVQTFDLKEKPGATNIFSDVSGSYWAADYIRVLSSHGVTLGSNGAYMPHQSLTRGQYAAFLSRLLD